MNGLFVKVALVIKFIVMKSFTITFTTLILGSIVLLQFSCKKADNSISVSPLKFNVKALEYVKLTEGKYLIYKDSSNSTEDSVVIKTSWVDTMYQPSTGGGIWSWSPVYYYERCKLTLSRFTGTSSSVWLSGFAKMSYGDYLFGEMNLYEESGAYPSLMFYFGPSTVPILAMTVEGRTYNNVVETIWGTPFDISDPLYKKTTTYWAKGIGIIKREVITTGGVSKTYTLLRNN